MPNYEYYCQECKQIQEMVRPIEQRNEAVNCFECGELMGRLFRTAPEVRTPKTSVSFLEGTKRDGFEDLKKAHLADLESLKYKPGSPEHEYFKNEEKKYKELKTRK